MIFILINYIYDYYFKQKNSDYYPLEDIVIINKHNYYQYNNEDNEDNRIYELV